MAQVQKHSDIQKPRILVMSVGPNLNPVERGDLVSRPATHNAQLRAAETVFAAPEGFRFTPAADPFPTGALQRYQTILVSFFLWQPFPQIIILGLLKESGD